MIAYLDCSTGVSGDKLLGALVSAGFDIGRLQEALLGLGLEAVRIETSRATSHGVTGIGVSVTEPGAPRRHWRELRSLLDSPHLDEPVRRTATGALRALAEAEAEVHGVDIDDVHFHEIGAADTLADVLGVAMAIHGLGIGTLIASPVAVGAGTVATEHGTMPVPAPATARLLTGIPIVAGTVDGELTTPTGAALLATFAADFGPVPAMVLRRTGTGCGTREIGVPNVCRLLVGEPHPDRRTDDTVLLESNIDHLTPEELAVAAQRLRDDGALDVWQTPIVMKKGRAAVMLSVLARPGDAAGLATRMIAETGTLGVRMLPAERRTVERDVSEIATSLGVARFKVAVLPDGSRALRVESDDAARIGGQHGLAADEVARMLEAEASAATGVQPMRQRPSGQVTKPSD